MTHWILLALLLLSDPAGDDHGAGLAYPRAEIYQQVGFADLRGFQLRKVDGAWQVGVRLDRYPNPASAPLGFSLAVVAVYLDTAPGGEETLPGAGLSTPTGGGWEEAYLISGWGAERRTANGERETAQAWRDGDWIWVQTGLAERPRAYVAAGIYDPFEPWAFRPALPGGGAWYLDGPASAPRALDVIAANDAAVYASGVLPPARSRFPWRALASGLLALAGAALLLLAARAR
ncbi:glucodextranase DOMON-like domain-containing protein [Oceanithermus sp.]|uniref:glucodextranase DOMON-like domain-containing protein n=1 Tax=Oceanithermus sp. TaxID=2268145 RepID=UPI0025CD7006|nr:glucodextranase DOMON-like domain-containing protein [Oceanithermus sp.]